MPNIFHQSVEDILKAATPEQKILWNDVFTRFGDRCAVSQLVVRGVPGELGTYVARKVYLAYQLTGTPNVAALGGAGFNRIELMDEANNLQNNLITMSVYWDNTAAAFRNVPSTIGVNNLIFSRLVLSGYQHVIFIGYRITY